MAGSLDPAVEVGQFRLGKLRVDEFDCHKLLSVLLRAASNRSGANVLVTVNAQFVVLAQRNTRFEHTLNKAEFACADGQSVCWAVRWLYGKKISRIAGIDLVVQLSEQAAANGSSIFLLGGQKGAAERAAAFLKARFPELNIAGQACPPYGFENHDEEREAVLKTIQDLKPNIVFVAMGAPRQELFIEKYLRPLHVPLSVGVGCTFDVLAGFSRRAPLWMQKSGLEWLYRMVREPRRLGARYVIGNAQFIGAVWKHRNSTMSR